MYCLQQTLRNVVSFCICLVCVWGGMISYAQENTGEPAAMPAAEEEVPSVVVPQESVIPYGGACFVNYGFTLTVHAGARYTYVDKARGRWNSTTTEGSFVDFRSELGLDRSATSFLVGASLSLDGWRLQFDYSLAEFEGDENLAGNLTIRGTTFAQNTNLDTSFEFTSYRWVLGYTIFANLHWGIGFDMEFELLKIHSRFAGTEAITGNAATQGLDRYTLLPKPGVHIDFSWTEPLVFTLAVHGLTYKHNERSFNTLNASLTGRWYWSSSFFVFVEGVYDYSKLVSERDDDLDGKFVFQSGLGSVGIGINF